MKKLQEKAKVLESENSDLKDKICFGRKFLIDEKICLEKVFESKRKDLQSKKISCETINVKISKHILDFERVLIIEREKFEKERTDFETERKSFNAKSVELSIKITDLEKILEKEKKEFECKESAFQDDKKAFEKKKIENDFEEERKIFKTEIRKLTKKLSDLSAEIMT